MIRVAIITDTAKVISFNAESRKEAATYIIKLTDQIFKIFFNENGKSIEEYSLDSLKAGLEQGLFDKECKSWFVHEGEDYIVVHDHTGNNVFPEIMYPGDEDRANVNLASLAPGMFDNLKEISEDASWNDEDSIEDLRRRLDNISERADRSEYDHQREMLNFLNSLHE